MRQSADERRRGRRASRWEGRPPRSGSWFASPDLPLADALRAARSAAGTQQIIGCTTAGEVTERGLTHGGVAVLLVAAPKSVSESATVPGLKEDPKRAAAELCRNFGSAQGKARAKGLAFSTTVVLADGLSGVGEELVRQMVAQTGVMLGDRVARARAPLSVGADGSLTCAAGVRQGSRVAILDGVPENMVAAARAFRGEDLARRPPAEDRPPRPDGAE